MFVNLADINITFSYDINNKGKYDNKYNINFYGCCVFYNGIYKNI